MSSQNSGWFGLNKIRSWWSNWQWSRDPTFQRFFNTTFFNSSTPVLIDSGTQNIIKVYQDCPHLRAVIDKRGEFFANGQWKCYAITDTELETPIEDDEGLKLLKKPNVFQSGEDLLKDYLFYKDLYANNFLYQLNGSALTLPRALWNLDSQWMEIDFTGKFYDQIELSGIIKRFALCHSGVKQYYDVKDVMYKPERFSITDGRGMSKVPTLQLPISNIIAALKTRNILSVNKGMIGFISSEGKDVVGPIALKSDQRKMIEDTFADDTNLYSENAKIKITNVPTKWNPTSYPTKDLALFEEIEDDFNTILACYGLRREIFPTTNGSTFENQKEAEKSTYMSTIQPEADAFAAMITTMLKGEERKRKYVLTYDWLPIMSTDKLKDEQTLTAKAQRLDIMLLNGTISHEAYAEAMGVKMTGDKKILGVVSTRHMMDMTDPENPVLSNMGSGGGKQTNDQLGKIPLALQQLALARERANTAGDTALSKQLSDAMDSLTNQLMNSVIE